MTLITAFALPGKLLIRHLLVKEIHNIAKKLMTGKSMKVYFAWTIFQHTSQHWFSHTELYIIINHLYNGGVESFE